MMNCHWTEKVSLLIDGELADDEAAEVRRHLRACALCQSAQQDFLYFHTQLSAYPPAAAAAPAERQEALARILATRPGQSSPRDMLATSGRKEAEGWRATGLWGERYARLSGAWSGVPAWAAACVLLIIAAVIGLKLMSDSRRHATTVAVVPATADAPRNPPRAASTTTDIHTTGAPSEVGENRPAVATNEGASQPRRSHGTPHRERRRAETVRAPVGATHARPQGAPLARGGEPRLSIEPPAAGGETAALPRTTPERGFTIDAVSRTERHVEQAQMLLRSFRNARLAGGKGGATDIAHDRQRSQKLLYRNIVLRREAASTGNLPIEKVLSSLEPILIDIANLPAHPARGDMRAIRERMQRKNIVAMLQVSGARSSSGGQSGSHRGHAFN